jgi:purine-binding chemotaxis protein CheW
MSTNVSELHAKFPDQRIPGLHPGPGRIRHRHPESQRNPQLRNPDPHRQRAGIRQGRVNLRGIIVPIVDMRIKFNLGTPSYDQFTVVIILNIGHRVVGMVVDRVSDVTTLLPEQIKPAPEIGSALNTDHIVGLGTIDERMLILVDIDKLMSSADMGLIENTALAA